jgi:phosphate transport system substrate-binding protein
MLQSTNRSGVTGAMAYKLPSATIAILTAAISLSTAGTAQGVDVVNMDGSSTVFPISEAVAEEFQSKTSSKVTVGVSGTGGGFKKFCAGEIHLSGASRPIKDEEAALCKAKGIEFQELPVALDALTVVVHPDNTWAESMTVDELKKIWSPESQDSITKWGDVKSGWPDEKFTLYAPGTDSGTFDYFTDEINGEEGASRTDFTASEDDNILVQGVLRDKNAMAYFGYAYYKENESRLKAVAINGVKPSESTVNNGSYKPLSRQLYIYVSKAAAKDKAVNDFVKYYLENTARLSAEVGYISLPSELSQKAMESYSSGKTGTIFSSQK